MASYMLCSPWEERRARIAALLVLLRDGHLFTYIWIGTSLSVSLSDFAVSARTLRLLCIVFSHLGVVFSQCIDRLSVFRDIL